jgi:hypothetical protein
MQTFPSILTVLFSDQLLLIMKFFGGLFMVFLVGGLISKWLHLDRVFNSNDHEDL